ncbi:lipase family protein [Chryseolinea sp. T2]|uniref:lipase family protein n=1 Tax=Chryseolinea sp. T2 TaxID=3129255 RepID=UPI0030780C6A
MITRVLHISHRYNGDFVRCVLLAAILLGTVACQNDGNDPQSEEPHALVDATLVYTLSATQIQAIAKLSGLDINVSEFVGDVDIYKVKYNTEYKGVNLVASGLISLPKSGAAAPVISYQHATITRDADAPSNFSVSKPETLVAGAFSSSGFVTVIPDYVGYGSTSSTFHPFFVEDALAASVIDMLHAAIELAEEKNVTLDKKLFLAGYSEGGYVTMATHKAIEADGVGYLELTASFPGAGAYDLQDIQERLFAMNTYEYPFYLGYITLAYQHTYGFNTVLTDFFQEPYASRMPGLFDNLKGFGEINSQLTTDVGALIQPELRTGLLTDTRYKYLADAFKQNSLTDWKPTKRMFMYHGTSDTTVPFENSKHTYDVLIGNGTSTDIVSLTPLPGDHLSAVTPYVADLLIKISALK